MPHEIAGNATLTAPSASATASALAWQEARRRGSSSLPEKIGPAVWMIHRHGRSPPMVATASPVGSGGSPRSEATRRRSARALRPAARVIAPSTPPPGDSEVFAAFTMASTVCCVMSPRTIEIVGAWSSVSLIGSS